MDRATTVLCLATLVPASIAIAGSDLILNEWNCVRDDSWLNNTDTCNTATCATDQDTFFGRVMGRMQSVTIPMVMIGTPATGYLFDLTGNYDAAFLMFTVAAGLAMAALAPLRVPTQAG